MPQPSENRPPDSRQPAALTVFAVAGIVMIIGIGLYVARGVLVPLAFGLVAAFVLRALADWLGQIPGGRHVPGFWRHMLVLSLFVVAIFAAFSTLRSNGELLALRLPQYTQNIQNVMTRLDARFGIDEIVPGGLSQLMADNLHFQRMARQTLGAAGSLGGTLTLVLLYAGFLMLEYDGYARKLRIALPDGRAEALIGLFGEINARIGSFLAIKTLINLLLAIVSYIALRLMGVELAGFWAIVIGMLNYTPYLGTAVGIVAPTLMTLAQTGDAGFTLLACAILSVIQFVVSSLIEPQVMARHINLSPVVVLLALAGWYALWGLAGAVLAVPLTVIILAVLAANPFTRPVAVLMSNDGRIGESPGN